MKFEIIDHIGEARMVTATRKELIQAVEQHYRNDDVQVIRSTALEVAWSTKQGEVKARQL